MRKFLVTVLLATAASANDVSIRSMQSGSHTGGTPIFDRGIHGQGQIIAILDTGLDYRNCYFAEPDGSLPPINTGTHLGGLQSNNVDPSRRKVIAYNFLYSCDQYRDAPGCEDPFRPGAYEARVFDNTSHGTRAAGAAAGDKGTPLVHDFGDGMAPGAKLVIQDGGFLGMIQNGIITGGDACSQRPGFGCPVVLTPILQQAYTQGARIHSNSWGDLSSPRGGYGQPAQDVDAFIASHPDMLVVFNTGNFNDDKDAPPARSVSSPGAAKNTLQVGGTRGNFSRFDDVLAAYSLIGPTIDGRLKPDVVAPAFINSADASWFVNGDLCGATQQPGTSWASPSVAGAAALVRQYYTDGFYPSGARTAGHGFTPSAALLKATIIASTRAVPFRALQSRDVTIPPPPSNDQGFGFPVLDDALFFPGDKSRLRVVDVPTEQGLAAGETAAVLLNVRAGTRLRAILVWTDPAGTPRSGNDTTPQLVNDLDLRVTGPGVARFGNEEFHPGQPDRLNNVEGVLLETPAAGLYTITVNANRLGSGARQSYALVITGDFESATPPKRRAIRR
ncbi:MAG TPA: S8 family serine peptidase [Thermoanaerobaculia bacterium]|nr:S8 family serine peptidase [Thermoanaerobaculia bacterium]